MATETARSSTSSADSYIGSLISLTSKSEIRYEGILCNINTDESSIGLSNVRSFGTEGRKKDGPQFMPSDKVYEYILFRGSDIKDLQVKSSQPVQPSQPINSDPAIIQSHYPRPPTVSTTAGPTTHNLGQPGSTYPGGLPLYQPGGNIGSWAPSPPPPLPNTNTSVPSMYWPGYYPPPPPQLHQQQSLPRPPPPPPPSQAGLPMPPPSLQYPFNPPLSTSEPPNANFPDYPSPFTTSTMPLPSLMQNSKLPNPSAPPLPPESQPPQLPTPSLVTPGQLLQSVAAVGGSAQTPPAVHKEVEVVQVVPTSSPPPPPPATVPAPVAAEAQPPILPLPPQSQMAAKPNGGNYQNRHSYNYRGRERGRGSGGSRPVMKFTEEFDFSAMNEKFNKDEVWGSLGKSSNKDKDGNATDEDDEVEEEAHPNLPKVDVKPVYSKDDFFDSLSSNSLDRQSNYGRTRFSEQMKLDTETFGEFSRYRGGGRGGRGPYRGGRGRGGGYYGRGGGGGYYVGRGRGGRNPNQNQNLNQSGGGDY